VYFGLFDFANSQGYEPNWNNTELLTVFKKFVQMAKKSGVAVGTIASNTKDLDILELLGIDYIVILNDLGIIHEATKKL
jgi:2-keto-3-deoxy-L-rhamnonate aldolase RhmA